MVLAKVDHGFQSIEKALTAISWIVTIAVTWMIVTDVALRFLFNRPLPASWEISEICMPTIVFFAFAYTLTIDQHIKVSLVRDKVSPPAQKVFDILNYSISIVMCALLTYWSWKRFWSSFIIQEEILAAIYLPWWPGKLAMPVGMGFLTVRYIFVFINTLISYKTAK